MKRVNIICEGPTEERFVKDVLYPHFIVKGLILTARTLGTGNKYGKLRYNILEWMKEEPDAYVTTLIDLYGMNRHFPGYPENKGKLPLDKVKAVEAAVKVDIDKEGFDPHRFIPYFQLHEFEALLFSAPDILQEWLSLDRAIKPNTFQTIRNGFETPEHINDDPNTAPSKRILYAVPSYNKVAEGVLIASDIGLDRMRTACLHFNAWITKMETLVLTTNP